MPVADPVDQASCQCLRRRVRPVAQHMLSLGRRDVRWSLLTESVLAEEACHVMLQATQDIRQVRKLLRRQLVMHKRARHRLVLVARL